MGPSSRSSFPPAWDLLRFNLEPWRARTGRLREGILDRHKDRLYTSRLRPGSGTGARMDQSIAAAEQPRYIKLNERDNVAIVVNDFGLPAGSQFSCGLQLRAFVPQGHKTAL